jgi:hypothetical protein
MVVLNAGPLLLWFSTLWQPGYTLPGPAAVAPRLFTASLVRRLPRTSGLHPHDYPPSYPRGPFSLCEEALALPLALIHPATERGRSRK